MWWWAFSWMFNNSDKESSVNTLLVISTLARWPELSKRRKSNQPFFILKGVVLIILECNCVKERQKHKCKFEFWITPIYPSIPLDGANLDLNTRTSIPRCAFSQETQTGTPKINHGIRSNLASYKTAYKLVLRKSSTLFGCFLVTNRLLDIMWHKT